MEKLLHLFESAISTVIFCVAVVLFLNQATSYRKTLYTLKQKVMQNDQVMYEQFNVDFYENDRITHAELLSILFGPLDYDIEINGLLISKYSHTADQIDTYNIEDTDYQKSFIYDSNGNLTRIVYTSI